MTDSWQLYNDFLLYGELSRFTKILARYELYKEVIEVPGDIVECGVLKGAGVLFWAKLVSIFNPHSSRRVIGFDTFEGYLDDKGKVPSQSPETIMSIAKRQGLADRIGLIQGDACKTIPEYIASSPGVRIALLNLDFDDYLPTSVALESLYPKVVHGGIIIADEYAIGRYTESEAIDGFIEGKNISLQSFSWAWSPTAFFRKE